MMLAREADHFDHQSAKGPVLVVWVKWVKCGNPEGIRIHAAVEHCICFQQLEPCRPFRFGRAKVARIEICFFLAFFQIALLKQHKRLVVVCLGVDGTSVLKWKKQTEQKTTEPNAYPLSEPRPVPPNVARTIANG